MRDSKDIVNVFKAFSDIKRIEILRFLTTGEKTATELAELMNLSQPNLSHHLMVLYFARIVVYRKEGKWSYYSISPEGVEMAKELLVEVTTMVEPEKEEETDEEDDWEDEVKLYGEWSWSR